MSNLKEIKRKIKSVLNTQKTTKAMKLVSTAKFKKAEEVARQSRAYANKIQDVVSQIALHLSDDTQMRIFRNDSKTCPVVNCVDIIFITADKGLCGGFNMATIKAAKAMIADYEKSGVKVRLRAVGKKGIEFFNFCDREILKTYRGYSSMPTYEKAVEVISAAIEDFEKGITDKVVLIHNGYKNMISQELKITNIAPIELPQGSSNESLSALEVEPEDANLLAELAKKFVEYSTYYALIDSLAAEHSARMQSMDNASKNAKERAKLLELSYNKARQESITTELIEIISGVESMK